MQSPFIPLPLFSHYFFFVFLFSSFFILIDVAIKLPTASKSQLLACSLSDGFSGVTIKATQRLRMALSNVFIDFPITYGVHRLLPLTSRTSSIAVHSLVRPKCEHILDNTYIKCFTFMLFGEGEKQVQRGGGGVIQLLVFKSKEHSP